jgi:transcriptional regulator with XRE-family HTH domain
MTGVSETIIKLRTEKGWTQQELADRLIVSRSLING